MVELDAALLQAYRQRAFRLRSDWRLRDPEDARRFVAERGFVYFWPITGVVCPSLWAATAGDRPVADEHDDPGHVTWRWKDGALDKRWWYYAKVLRGKATLIAIEATQLSPASCFYALSENYGEPEQDYLDQYRDGLISHEARLIYEALLEDGSLDTVNLRRKIRMTSQASNAPFESALTYLQRDFKILPVGVAETGAWRYSFIYECTHRWFPDLPNQARAITRKVARQKLVELYLQSVGAARVADMRRLFQWRGEEVEAALAASVQTGRVQGDCRISGEAGEWWTWAGLLAGS